MISLSKDMITMSCTHSSHHRHSLQKDSSRHLTKTKMSVSVLMSLRMVYLFSPVVLHWRSYTFYFKCMTSMVRINTIKILNISRMTSYCFNIYLIQVMDALILMSCVPFSNLVWVRVLFISMMINLMN